MIENLFSLKNKVVLVTGGAKGIGAMITQGLVESGAKVYIASRSGDACQAFANEMNALGKGTCIGASVDLSNMDSINGLVQEISKNEEGICSKTQGPMKNLVESL